MSGFISAANRQPPDAETTAAAAAAAEMAADADNDDDGPAAGPVMARPKLRHKRYPLMNQLSREQEGYFRTIANTYIPDMVDPAAVEVLLVLLEVCHILDLIPTVLARIFGARVLAALETWGDLVPPRRRPGLVRRAWVWLPNQARPRLYPLADDGTIRVREVEIP